MTPNTTTRAAELVTTGPAARIAGVSAETMRAWERRGWVSSMRVSGLRLFDAGDVRRAAERRARLRADAAAGETR